MLNGTTSLVGPSIAIETDLVGYNANLTPTGLGWGSASVRQAVTRLDAGSVRYPGGTIANYWDWKTGTVIQSIDSGKIKYDPAAKRNTPADFVNGIGPDADPVFVMNLSRPTDRVAAAYLGDPNGKTTDLSDTQLRDDRLMQLKINDLLDGIRAFNTALQAQRGSGASLRYVELGNEFYPTPTGATAEGAGVYYDDVELYVRQAGRLADAIAREFPSIEMAAIGETTDRVRQPDGTVTDPTQLTPWTRRVVQTMTNPNGWLKNVDALTLHWYSGPGINGTQPIGDPELSTDQKRQLAETALLQPFRQDQYLRDGDLALLPGSIDLWITEHNTFSSASRTAPLPGGPIQGTWVNGLWTANQTLELATIDTRVDLMHVHSISTTNSQWAMLEDAGTLSGNGVAMSLVAGAMKGKTRVQKLAFSGLGDMRYGNNRFGHTLSGYKFWNGTTETVVVINNTRAFKQNLSVDGVFGGAGNLSLISVWDRTPWTRDVNENTLRNNGNDFSIQTTDESSRTIDLQPFSITVLTRQKANLIRNGNFESSKDGWFGDGTRSSRNTKQASDGQRSLVLVNNDATRRTLTARQRVGVEQSTQYLLRADVRTNLRFVSGQSQGFARIGVRYLRGNNTVIDTRWLGTRLTGQTASRPLTLRFQTPPGTARVEVMLQANQIRGTVWVDTVELIRTGAAPAASTAAAPLAARSSLPTSSTGETTVRAMTSPVADASASSTDGSDDSRPTAFAPVDERLLRTARLDDAIATLDFGDLW